MRSSQSTLFTLWNMLIATGPDVKLYTLCLDAQ